MKISQKGISLIHEFESFRSKPYLDVAGIPTIGWGNTYYEDGKSVKMTDNPITKERGNELFSLVVKRFENAVNDLITVHLEQCQFDALVSFAYNVGIGAFEISTLRKKVNGDPCNPDILQEFRKWNKATIKGKKVVVSGLTRRREAEGSLYFSC